MQNFLTFCTLGNLHKPSTALYISQYKPGRNFLYLIEGKFLFQFGSGSFVVYIHITFLYRNAYDIELYSHDQLYSLTGVGSFPRIVRQIIHYTHSPIINFLIWTVRGVGTGPVGPAQAGPIFAFAAIFIPFWCDSFSVESIQSAGSFSLCHIVNARRRSFALRGGSDVCEHLIAVVIIKIKCILFTVINF